MSLEPEWDPGLVEAAVLRAIAGRSDEVAFRTARDPLYETPDGEPREAAFAALHGEWFLRLGLGDPVRTALAEQPTIAAHCGRCLVARARGHRDEEADLRVAPDGSRTSVIRVVPERLAAADAFLIFLRRELLHVADMLDPAFGYSPVLPAAASGAGREQLVRARYRVLWDASVDGRLLRRGRVSPAVESERRRETARAFPDPEARAAFDRVFNAAAVTHAELLALATGHPGP
jgi:hypothetical protein